MTTQEQINKLETRQLELLTIMSNSDAHAAKCAKLGKDFYKEYPEDYNEYTAANSEYNSNEALFPELKKKFEEEKAEEETKRLQEIEREKEA
jgi:PHP family Zn ribbon phosphoesterase